jgi:hypothetical protein
MIKYSREFLVACKISSEDDCGLLCTFNVKLKHRHESMFLDYLAASVYTRFNGYISMTLSS